jgi:hypothetical protein
MFPLSTRESKNLELRKKFEPMIKKDKQYLKFAYRNRQKQVSNIRQRIARSATGLIYHLNRPSSANEGYPSLVIIIWSSTEISKNFPLSDSFFVSFISASLAVRLPEGWLCARIIRQALALSTCKNYLGSATPAKGHWNSIAIFLKLFHLIIYWSVIKQRHSFESIEVCNSTRLLNYFNK